VSQAPSGVSVVMAMGSPAVMLDITVKYRAFLPAMSRMMDGGAIDRHQEI
jgi:hypothetical protein